MPKYVRNDNGELEHRSIAILYLHRKLNNNEIVHHIDGVEDNNHPTNLCVMDRKKHEHFHSWLQWYKGKKGRYPDLDYQLTSLVEEYGGLLIAPLFHKFELHNKIRLLEETVLLQTEKEKESSYHLSELLDHIAYLEEEINSLSNVCVNSRRAINRTIFTIQSHLIEKYTNNDLIEMIEDMIADYFGLDTDISDKIVDLLINTVKKDIIFAQDRILIRHVENLILFKELFMVNNA